jgi:hypothetical protein
MACKAVLVRECITPTGRSAKPRSDKLSSFFVKTCIAVRAAIEPNEGLLHPRQQDGEAAIPVPVV